MIKSYIGYSKNSNIRFKATSGGVGTALLKWMFDKGKINTAISFSFNSKTLKYEPVMIHSFDEYQISGSIYHELDLIGFIRTHVNEIHGGFACFALPCQTRAIRSIIQKSGHVAFLIGLTCSSQQRFEATSYLLRKINVDINNVDYIQYRGNGWPSGIHISLKDGNVISIPNRGSIWTDIFHSRLFIRSKCFKCQDTLNRNSDITLADPWLPEYLQKETIGKSLIMLNNVNGGGICKAVLKMAI